MSNETESNQPENERHSSGSELNCFVMRDDGKKIKVTPEGRDGIWEADIDSVVDFLLQYEEETIHNFNPGGSIIMGADWSVDSVIEKVKEAERVAVMTGSAFEHNLKHALAVIVNNKLHMFDIGAFDA